jgi:REP element-mobilizing transposase RayT
MAPITPIYTASNLTVAYQLNWSFSVFWNDIPTLRQVPSGWLASLSAATEPDGVRILEHRFLTPEISQFFLSTQPHVSPKSLLRSVKGRLQHLIAVALPKALRRHYFLHSIGSATRNAVEQYVASQVEHHPMADPRVEEILERFQIRGKADLSRPRSTAHGLYCYNLHIVLVNENRWRDACEDRLRIVRDTILKIAERRRYLLSHAAILPDHIHLALGCGIEAAPVEAAMCYMNNLAYALGMQRVLQHGCYLGTFGEYDLRVVRRSGGGKEGEQEARR